ncbi:MAG: cbb3-type cytochrome oxidase assembly protein CcoS [Rhodothermales bacterium]
MNVLYILVPVALALAGLSVLAFRWASSSGQFDDVHTPALRVIMDDTPAPNANQHNHEQ